MKEDDYADGRGAAGCDAELSLKGALHRRAGVTHGYDEYGQDHPSSLRNSQGHDQGERDYAAHHYSAERPPAIGREFELRTQECIEV